MPRSVVASIVAATGITAVPAVLIGMFYGVAAWYSPIYLLSIALAVGSGALIGFIGARVAIARVLPSRPMLAVSVFLAGATAVYAAWAAQAAVSWPGLSFGAANPRNLIEYARILYEFGGITVETKNTATEYVGPGLVVIWIAEALTIAGGGGGHFDSDLSCPGTAIVRRLRNREEVGTRHPSHGTPGQPFGRKRAVVRGSTGLHLPTPERIGGR
jgi:hypothetical protein